MIPRMTTHGAGMARLRSRGPRIALGVAIGVLAIAGGRVAINGPITKTTITAPATPSAQALAERGFAEAFTAAVLTWNPDAPGIHEERIAPFLAAGLPSDAGISPGRALQDVKWTTAVSERDGATRTQKRITVAARLDTATVYLEVPVTRTPDGLVVDDYPAIVGPPVADKATSSRINGIAVEDAVLKDTVTRVLTNFLVRDEANLAADLADGVVLTFPGRAFSDVRVTNIVWPDEADTSQVLAEVDAVLSDETTMHMRYQLTVQKRDRWYVSALATGPATDPNTVTGKAAPSTTTPAGEPGTPVPAEPTSTTATP